MKYGFLRIKVFRIEWNTDGELVPELPNKVTLNIRLTGDIDSQICDTLSDEYGYLINNYEVEGYNSEANYALQMQSAKECKDDDPHPPTAMVTNWYQRKRKQQG